MTLMCDEKIFPLVPVKKEVKAVVSGIYIMDVKALHGKLPKPEEKKNAYVCTICGYVYEGDEVPDDFICPLCKHPAEDFERLE